MKKKFLALVLTLAMVLSLVPVTALATNGTEGGASQENTRDNLTMKKTVMPNKDGTYTVRLESYATGSVTTTQTPVPMDIVLVLDVSGSMDGEIASYTYQATRKTSWSVKDVYNDYYDWGWRTDVTYYAKVDDEYYPVFYKEKWVSQGWFKGYSEYWLEANNQVLGHKVTDSTWENTVYNQALYTRKTDPSKTTKKLDAMKSAVNNFIDSVAAQKNGDTPVAHRISIVKFAGNSKDEVGNHKYNNNKYNYTQKVTELTDVTTNGSVASLKKAVNDLTAGGATAADWGMQKAKDVLTKRDNKENPSIVIMFTDGEPNHGNGYEASVAGNTVQAAKGLKDGGTKVYTIGMFKDLQPSNADKVDTYMNGVSSNYPEAVKAYNDSGVTLGNRAEGNYYFKADNASDLEQVFQTISESTTVTSPLDASAVVVDNVPSNFALNKDSVKVYTAECTGKNGEKFTWGTDTPAQEISSTSTKNQDGSQTISTTGFKFSENWCGVDGDTHRGQKLIIEFTISRTNYGGTQPTNAGAYIKAGKEANETPIISLKDPEVPVTVQLPDQSNPYTDTKTYDGAGFDIKNEISKIIADLVPVNGIKNQFIDLTYEIKDSSENTVGTYTIPAGATTGTWSDTSTNITTGSNVGNYTYKITVIGQDKKQSSNKNSKECTATFTITQRDATFTGESKSVTWNGKNQTITGITAPTDLVSGHTYDGGLTYVAKGIDTGTYVGKFTGTAIIKDATGNDVTANYNVKTESGKLTITKEEVPYTVIFNANGGAWSDGDTTKTTSNLNADAKIELPNNNPEKDGKKFQGWGYYPNGMNAAPEQIPALSFKALTVERLYAVVNPTETPENTVMLYAIWKDVPQSAYTYTIRQHFMKDEKQKLGAQNYIELNEVQVGTEISTLIPSDTTVKFDGRMYLYEANNTTVNNQKYEGTEKITGKNTVIDLYYYLDSWKDGDIGPGDKTDDSLTGGDGIPDYKQILIQYQVYQEGNGLVTPEFEVVTVKDDKELTAIHGGSVTKAGTGYTFVTWTGQNVTVTEETVGDIIDKTSAEKLKKEKCDLSKDTFEQGKSYTYTAIFLEDKIGGGDNKDQPDGIPDRYQVTVNYVSSNTNWGSVNRSKEVITLINKESGKWAETGTVTAPSCTATSAGGRCYFVNWTKKQEGSTASSTVTSSANLPEQLIENAKGGDVYTFTANFGRSSGGSNRPKPPVVEIPDDVPTGLNGKDHYAYVVGYPDGMVYPQKNITRAEVATIFFRLLTDETREANMTKSNSYNDMKDGAWYTCAVSTLSKMGIIKGYEDGSFKPDASISRAEFAAIAARFDPDGDKTPATFSDVSSHWAKDEISIAANHGWIKGYEDGSFKPDQKITRAETMTLVNRVLKRLPETKDDLHKDMKTWPDNQNESAWFYLAVQEATNSHYQKLKKDGTHETWESMRETRDWAALEK